MHPDKIFIFIRLKHHSLLKRYILWIVEGRDFFMEYCGGYSGYGGYGGRQNNGSGFALIVVLFILLIIIGASFMNNKSCY